MDERTRQLRIRRLIAAHLLTGCVVAVVSVSLRTISWPFVVELGYVGFLVSEILLLGMWTGSGSNHWGKRLGGLVLGIAWLCIIFISSVNPQNYKQELPQIALMLSVCTGGVGATLISFRRMFGVIECRAAWPQHSNSEGLQFKLTFLLWLTALIGALISTGETIRSWGGNNLGILVLSLVFALAAALSAWLLLWAGLGCHNWVRIPLALSGVALVGILPPYYLNSGSPTWRWMAWPALSITSGIWTLASLWVVRSCGYRLVPWTRRRNDEREVAVIGK